MEFDAMQDLCPKELRLLFRRGEWAGSTGGLAESYLQGNLVVVSSKLAEDFERFCRINPQPCPLIDKTAPGGEEFSQTPGSNLYTDLPRYQVIRKGEMRASPNDIELYRDEGNVGFLLGCSVSFERALEDGGVPVRHLRAGLTAPMYVTEVEAKRVGVFSGPVVMTMRAIPEALVDRAIEITAEYPEAHGAPMHVGQPGDIGVNLSKPDFGDNPIVEDGDVPVFWGCGVTPQLVAMSSRLDMITHYPGAMFITDQEMP